MLPASRRLLLTALAVVLVTSVASAQRSKQFAQGSRPSVGPQLGYGTNDTKFFLGAQFAYPIANRFDLYPNFQYYFPGNSVHFWTLEGSARYWPKLNMKNSGLYTGAGLNINHSSVSVGGFSASSTDVGLALFSGWQFQTTSNLLPFGQIRVVIGNADRVDFGGGINFKLK
jgi:hypothetical protein